MKKKLTQLQYLKEQIDPDHHDEFDKALAQGLGIIVVGSGSVIDHASLVNVKIFESADQYMGATSGDGLDDGHVNCNKFISFDRSDHSNVDDILFSSAMKAFRSANNVLH